MRDVSGVSLPESRSVSSEFRDATVYSREEYRLELPVEVLQLIRRSMEGLGTDLLSICRADFIVCQTANTSENR